MEELHKRDLYTEAMSQTAERQGRRERKKAATSSALTAAARRLVLARGYEAVTVVDIAEEADTAVTTLFKHFPDGKNAVIFGDNVDSADERMQSIITAVESRADGQSVLDALHQFFRDRGAFSGTQSAFVRRVVEAPPLRAYAKERWERCEGRAHHPAGRDRGATGGRRDPRPGPHRAPDPRSRGHGHGRLTGRS